MDPIYSAENTKAAYQLNWSVALFGSNEVPSSTDWLPQLKSATEPDGILSNHIYILVGIGVNESPESAALSLLNNLAFAQGWKPVFRFSYYAGTFGGYDRDAIRRAVKEA